MPRRWGILWRAALLSWLVTAIAVVLFAYFLIPYQRNLLVQRLRSAAEVAATSIAEVTVSSIIVENYGTVVDHCLEVVGERPAVRYIVITRRDGFSLVHLEDSWRYDHLDGYWLPHPDAVPAGSFRSSDLVGEEVYHYCHPLQYSGIDWGWIHIALSLEDFRQGLASIYRRTAALGLLCVLLGFAASLVFARQLTDPLRALTESADRVARGDLSVRAAVHTRDEVQQLADSFNAMTEALQATRGSLETAVADRTRELSESEARWRSLVESAPDLILTADAGGTVQFVSRESPVFRQGGRLLDCAAPDHRDALARALEAAAQTGEAQTLEIRGGLMAQPETAIVLRMAPILSDGEYSALIIVATDVTARVKTEERIVHLERLSALGEMAAGVSHNLNNILTGIMGPAQLMLEDAADGKMQRWARQIQAASERAAEVVHRLYLSTRGVHEDELAAVDLNATVQEATRTAQPRWKDEPEARGVSVEVELRLTDDRPMVKGTASGLHDVALNLLLNAVEAVAEGGSVTVSTAVAADGLAALEVRDTGVGMDEETRRRVFEPFFTTRKDVGSGLGLATCYGTVTRWGGAIEVSSEVGVGSTFTVHLPLAAEPGAPGGVGPAEVASRRGAVLVVDDEPATCRLLSETLADGHQVEVAADGSAALAQAAARHFDVALVDLGMPSMPGDRCARELRRRSPGLVTILITGWELKENDPRREPFDFVVKKPFQDLRHLRQLVVRAVRLSDERRGGGSGAAPPEPKT